MKNNEEKIRKRDASLVKNEKSWRRARVGAICLSIIHILIFILMFKELQEESKEGLVSIVIIVIFWLLIISWLNLRLGHIDSIKLYRNSLNNLEQHVNANR